MNFKVLQIIALSVPAFASTLNAAEELSGCLEGGQAAVPQVDSKDVSNFLQDLSVKKGDDRHLAAIQQKLNPERQNKLVVAGAAAIVAAMFQNKGQSPYAINALLAASGIFAWSAFAKKHNKAIHEANIDKVFNLFSTPVDATTMVQDDESINNANTYEKINKALESEYTYSKWSCLLPAAWVLYLGYNTPAGNKVAEAAVQVVTKQGAKLLAKVPKNVTASLSAVPKLKLNVPAFAKTVFGALASSGKAAFDWIKIKRLSPYFNFATLGLYGVVKSLGADFSSATNDEIRTAETRLAQAVTAIALKKAAPASDAAANVSAPAAQAAAEEGSDDGEGSDSDNGDDVVHSARESQRASGAAIPVPGDQSGFAAAAGQNDQEEHDGEALVDGIVRSQPGSVMATVVRAVPAPAQPAAAAQAPAQPVAGQAPAQPVAGQDPVVSAV